MIAGRRKEEPAEVYTYRRTKTKVELNERYNSPVPARHATTTHELQLDTATHVTVCKRERERCFKNGGVYNEIYGLQQVQLTVEVVVGVWRCRVLYFSLDRRVWWVWIPRWELMTPCLGGFLALDP